MSDDDWSFLKNYSDQELLLRVELAGGIVNTPVFDELVRRGLYTSPLIPEGGLPYTKALIYKEGILAGSTVGGREEAFAYVFPPEEANLVNDGFAHLLPVVQAFLKEDELCPTK